MARVRLIDCHCHLNADRFERTPTRSSGRRVCAGLERVLVPGWNVASSERALGCADRFPWLDAAVGIHPHDAAKVDDAGWARIVAWATDPRVVAIGETGLDYDRVFSPIPDQLDNLRRNLALALDDRQAGHPPLPLGGRPARRPGRPRRRSCARPASAARRGQRLSGAAACGHPLVLGSARLRPEVLDLGLAISFSGLVFRRGEESVGRCRRDRAGRPAPGRDRFAVPVAARRAALA